MSGWGFGSKKPDNGNFHAVTDLFPQDQLFAELEPKDLEWTCASGFVTETYTWYTVLQDGSFATSQIIHSSLGTWASPMVQMTFKYYNPNTNERIWKSLNSTTFKSEGANKDKRSCKADEFSVDFSTDPDGNEKHSITANIDADVQLSYTFTRPAGAKGWKLGAGPKGGYSYFGADQAKPDGYVMHRFWPQVLTDGHIIIKGRAIDATGQGMFVLAIQGMRPNLVASTWNFANFQANDDKLGRVSALMMEFTTTWDYGGPKGTSKLPNATATSRERVTVNIGSVVVDGKLIAVAGSKRGDNQSEEEPSKLSNTRTLSLDKVKDQETDYNIPQTIKYVWDAPLLDASNKGQLSERVGAELSVSLGKPYPREATNGLVDKVDVLAEIPYFVKKLISYVSSAKPFVYQTLNPVTLKLSLPAKYSGRVEGGATYEVAGKLFEEHTMVNND